MIDLKNAASQEIAAYFSHEVNNMFFKPDTIAEEQMAMDHRTLQQTFSILVFYHFMLVCNKKEAQTLLKIMGDSFYKLPLI